MNEEVELDLFDLAAEWAGAKKERLYRCPHHEKPEFGCAECVRERDARERLREEARELLPASFLELITD